jgi:SAM-dependent methyltransferase
MEKIKLPRRNEAYFDFVVELKNTIGKFHYGEMEGRYKQKAQEYAAQHAGATPQSPEEIAALVEDYTPYKFSTGIKRKAQEQMWQGVIEAYTPYQEELVASLNQLHPESKSTLTLDPGLRLPEYLAKNEFHIQPGGYYAMGDMSAYVFEMGGNLYFRKTTGNFRIQKALAAAVPPGDYKRILDIGCTTGGNAIAFKLQFPEAEVHAIDAAPGVLKMGYQYAVDHNLEIHFSQQNVERTNFEDNSFDLVTCFILFHEMPIEAVRQTLREAYRILKPGGLMFSGDVTPFRENEPWRSFISSWEVENNGETYWREILEKTFMPDEFKAAGFREVREFGVRASMISPKFPWATLGYK